MGTVSLEYSTSPYNMKLLMLLPLLSLCSCRRVPRAGDHHGDGHDDNCVDISRYGPVLYNETRADVCSYKTITECRPRSQEVCVTVPITECAVVGYTDCQNTPTTSIVRDDSLETHQFVKQDCVVSDQKETITEMKKMPVCRNVTKQQCHTPLRQQMQRAKLAAMFQSSGSRLLLPSSNIRTSPRKRLTLSDTPPPSSCLSQVFTPSPDKLKMSPLTKRVRIDPSLHNINPETAIKGLSHSQLISLMGSILQRHPELVEEVHTMLPSPDLTPMEEKLNYLKRNIYKALPNTRLESKTDSMAYNRVSIHLTMFKKAVVDSVKSLLEGQQWLAIIDYTVMAWAYVQATPVWENPSHNNIRKTCFKSLAASCMTALKKGHFKAEQCEEIKRKLSKLKADSDEIVICLKHLEENSLKQQ